MDIVVDIVNPIRGIYNLIDRTKNNNQQCPQVLERLKALKKLAIYMSQKEPDQLSEDVNEAVEKLNKVLTSAAELIRKFEGEFKMTQVVNAGSYKSEFDSLNKSLTDSFVTLSGALHVQQEKKLDEQEKKLDEQQKKLDEQEKKLDEQEKKLDEQEKKLDKLDEQEGRLAEQENMSHGQKKKLAELERKLAEQDDLLQRVDSKLTLESRAYYCIKRGFTSHYGIGVCMDILTGLVVDFEVLPSYCNACALKECAIGEVHQLRYTEMLSDGDSAAFKEVVALNPCPGHEVVKLECINHAYKRMGTALRKLSAERKLGGKGQGKLTAKKCKAL
ncbi:uncharacterized protein LOC114560119 [Perca flavescens]|uniref:uncharacterized protein LOC114560119 n=1 Tax=Perca flavescens TaxID=8167 RepID=UPI00106DF7F7|nr:uncharacterized protein LOC114560119 [Perca flavescens]